MAAHEQAQHRVTLHPRVVAAEERKDPAKSAQERERAQEIREELADEQHTANIQDFLNEHYLYLPTNRASGASRLLLALQSRPYAELEKHGGTTRKNMAYMNEERRRRLGLPALTAIDYNCVERAAQKLRLVLDCLMLSRRMSGYSVVPKDIPAAQAFREQERRRERHQRTAKQLNKISRTIYREWGVHVVLEPEFNPESAQVQESILKIKEYQQRQHLMQPVEEGSARELALKV